MSLINEALKKAQRQRTAGEVDPAAVPGGVLSGRGQPRGAKNLGLIAGGAVALVVVSVIVTLKLNRSSPATPPSPPAAKTQPAPIVASPVAAPTPKESSPIVSAPEKKVAAPETKSTPAPVAKSEPAVTPPPVSITTIPQSTGNRPPPAASPATAPIVSAQPPVGTPPSSAPTPVLAERINAFLDTAVIKGALPRGAESRVIMNEKFYRLNEFVDRTLQLRLIKVESNNLTFSDENGALYVKYF